MIKGNMKYILALVGVLCGEMFVGGAIVAIVKAYPGWWATPVYGSMSLIFMITIVVELLDLLER